jgi:hypothetical protein
MALSGITRDRQRQTIESAEGLDMVTFNADNAALFLKRWHGGSVGHVISSGACTQLPPSLGFEHRVCGWAEAALTE